MTKQEAVQRFKDVWKYYLQDNPHIQPDDKPAKRELWNNWTDMLAKEGSITEHQYDTWSGPPGLEGLGRYNQPDYEYYVVNATDESKNYNKIISGWSRRKDALEANEEANERIYAKVWSKESLLGRGIDPDVDTNWTGGSGFEGTENNIGNIIFYAKTRGSRYEIKVFKGDDNAYDFHTYTRGMRSGSGLNYNKQQMQNRISSMIKDAKKYDNINYQIVVNRLGI